MQRPRLNQHYTQGRYMISNTTNDTIALDSSINDASHIISTVNTVKNISCKSTGDITTTSTQSPVIISSSVNLKNTMARDISSTFEHCSKGESNVFNKQSKSTYTTRLHSIDTFEPVLDL
jgi:hypothetical protein